MGITVENLIRGSLDAVWEKTQTPALHQRWDLRFTDITYLPRPDTAQPQRFLYSTRLGFGLRISGEGETTADHAGAQGERTSSLKFWSNDRKSLILEGAGYWKYSPQADGVRFLTWYDYRTRFGWAGKVFDRLIFRPLIGWATAWSFDRLRLWIEQGIDPAVSFQRYMVYGIARLTVAFIWLYHGLVPKLIFHHPDEVAIMMQSGLSADAALTAVNIIGIAEVILGLLALAQWRKRWPLLVTIGLMVVTFAGVVFNSPGYMVAAFNPVTLNLSTIALAAIAYLASRDLPSARNCLRKQPERES